MVVTESIPVCHENRVRLADCRCEIPEQFRIGVFKRFDIFRWIRVDHESVSRILGHLRMISRSTKRQRRSHYSVVLSWFANLAPIDRPMKFCQTDHTLKVSGLPADAWRVVVHVDSKTGSAEHGLEFPDESIDYP